MSRPTTAVRPKSPSITRPKTATSNYAKIPIRQVTNVHPIDVQEIKLKTQQVLQKNKISIMCRFGSISFQNTSFH